MTILIPINSIADAHIPLFSGNSHLGFLVLCILHIFPLLVAGLALAVVIRRLFCHMSYPLLLLIGHFQIFS